MPATPSASPALPAIDKFSARLPTGSPLNTAGWADVPVALRERAFFSATIEHTETLQEMHNRIAQSLTLMRDSSGAYMDRSRFIGEMRATLSANGSELSTNPDSLTDITSRRRLGLIFDTNIDQAHGYTNWRYDMDPDVLDFYPAQMLIRVEPRKSERNWQARWSEAGNAVNWKGAVKSPMVALKTSPIWQKLSRFDTPWSPFDFGSGMGTTDVDRAEAEQRGLLDLGEQLPPGEASFNDALAASVSDVDPELRSILKSAFGSAIDIAGDIVSWVRS